MAREMSGTPQVRCAEGEIAQATSRRRCSMGSSRATRRTGDVGGRVLATAVAIIHIMDTEEGGGQEQKAALGLGQLRSLILEWS
jgi:hypothetical protein